MIEHTIYCDACGEMIDSDSGSTRQMRRKAKAKGLLIRAVRKDYCPQCAEKLPEEMLAPPAKKENVKPR